ncbi:MAG TPA: PIN domain-containing protein [Thermoanaerobaculia bacterium]|nr:PIN domain-containing protein [Thermoanaerobaculia bacterium]
MNVLVDTGVWSLALRRRYYSLEPAVLELRELIREGRAHLIGSIRQEVLSGIREKAQFDRLRADLREFPDLPVQTADHERAAEFFNVCRSRGVQGSNTDFVICAIAGRYGMAILATDGDFPLFAPHLPIQLHVPRH